LEFLSRQTHTVVVHRSRFCLTRPRQQRLVVRAARRQPDAATKLSSPALRKRPLDPTFILDDGTLAAAMRQRTAF
jgi:hypothetical protein